MRLTLSHVHKAYVGVPVLRGAALDLSGGEVHALMGENGAGKSTLIRVLAGLSPPERMEARLDDAPLPLATPGDAARAGFRFVHQELQVAPNLSVAETVFLGQGLPRRWGALVDWPDLSNRAAEALARLGAAHVDPRARVGRLGTGDRMLVRLASLLAGGEAPRLVVLDEPTAALTATESQRLFAVLGELRREGTAVLLVSHRLDEVMREAHRVTVLRDGAVALAAPLAGLSRGAVIEAMTGRGVSEDGERVARPGAPALILRGLSAGPLGPLDVELREGEVLGLAGLEGAGQTELLRLLLGDGPRARGEASLLGRPLPRSPAEAWRRGVAYVPRERRAEALVPRASVTANKVLPHLGRLSLLGLARPRRERAEAERLARALSLRHGGLHRPVRTLSGGNQQKVVLARATLVQPRLLLLDEPTRGVDVGARADIHAAIRGLADRGTAVAVASTDLPELLGLSDRILVLRDGRQAALVPARGLDAAGLLRLVQGAPDREAA